MDGLLGSVYSFGDRLKKRARGLINDPANQVKTNVESAAADMNEAMQTPEGMASMLLGSGLLGATVWHGSPYLFKRPMKFDPKRIGAGEGNQSFGYGHYLAEHPATAGTYKMSNAREALKSMPPEGSEIDPEVVRVVKKELDNLGYDHLGQAMTHLRSYGPTWYDNVDIRGVSPRDLALLDMHLKQYPGGYLYKTDLADSAIPKFLDYDKMGPERVKYRNPQYAAGAAKEGVPGIKYLDRASRPSGEGTYNYVVFPGNEELLKILEINGVPLQGLLR